MNNSNVHKREREQNSPGRKVGNATGLSLFQTLRFSIQLPNFELNHPFWSDPKHSCYMWFRISYFFYQWMASLRPAAAIQRRALRSALDCISPLSGTACLFWFITARELFTEWLRKKLILEALYEYGSDVGPRLIYANSTAGALRAAHTRSGF